MTTCLSTSTSETKVFQIVAFGALSLTVSARLYRQKINFIKSRLYASPFLCQNNSEKKAIEIAFRGKVNTKKNRKKIREQERNKRREEV